MSRLFSVGAAVVLVVFLGADAMAQRDAAAKARGDYRGFWQYGGGRSSSGRSYSNYSYARPAPRYAAPAAIAPLAAQEDSARAFSFEPVAVNPGDMVSVNRDGVRMMMGRNAVGDAPKGLEFKVTKVINGWLGAVVQHDGKQHKGWIWHGDVAPTSSQDAPPAPPTT